VSVNRSAFTGLCDLECMFKVIFEVIFLSTNEEGSSIEEYEDSVDALV